MLSKQTPYQDLGVDYFAVRQQDNAEQRLVKGLERLGYVVPLQPRAG